MTRAATLLLCAALAACNQTAAEAPAPATSHITDQQAFAAARTTVLANLKDPDSAKFGAALMRKTVNHTDIVCGTVNSKNSFGGYVGHSIFAYRIGRKDVFMDEVGPNAERLGSIWCKEEAVR